MKLKQWIKALEERINNITFKRKDLITMKFLRPFIISLSLILILLWLLNPSYRQFKEFSESSEIVYQQGNYRNGNGPKYTVVRKRIRNYLIYSIYEIGLQDQFGRYIPNLQYLGILNNFYTL